MKSIYTIAICIFLLFESNYGQRIIIHQTGGEVAEYLLSQIDSIKLSEGGTILKLPANNSAGISSTTTLSWNTVPGAISYALQVSTDVNFGSFFYDQSGLTSLSQQITGLVQNTKYYWRVNVYNSSGATGWSSVWNFTTIGPPTLVSPVNNAITVSTLPVLSWNAVPGATDYAVWGSINSDVTPSSHYFYKNGISTTSYQVVPDQILSPNTKYYWRVQAHSSAGWSDPSSIWSFTTWGAPPVPILISPASGTVGVPVSPTVTWQQGVGGEPATRFGIQVSDGGTIVYEDPYFYAFSKQIPGLSGGVYYLWRVCALGVHGTSDYTNWFTFKTIGPPDVPIQVSPANGAVGVPVLQTLTWNSDPNATSYSIQVLDSYGGVAYQANSFSGNSKQIPGLIPGMQYSWTVKAQNSYGASAWSNLWTFTTIASLPSTPILLSPADGTGAPLLPTLTWNAAANATGYSIEVINNSGNVVFQASFFLGTSKQITGLVLNNDYAWRVKAHNAYGTSAWSDYWYFWTQ